MLREKSQESDSLILYANFVLTFYKVIPDLQNYVGKNQLKYLSVFSICTLKLQADIPFVVLN